MSPLPSYVLTQNPTVQGFRCSLNLLSIFNVSGGAEHYKIIEILWEGCENPAWVLSSSIYNLFFLFSSCRVSFFCALRCRIYAKAIETFMYHRRPSERERHGSHVLVFERLIHMLERQMEIASFLSGGERRIRIRGRAKESSHHFCPFPIQIFLSLCTQQLIKRDELIYMCDDEIKPRVHFIIYSIFLVVRIIEKRIYEKKVRLCTRRCNACCWWRWWSTFFMCERERKSENIFLEIIKFVIKSKKLTSCMKNEILIEVLRISF
jgi:hypothetical protein